VSIKSFGAKWLANREYRKVSRWAKNAEVSQQKTFDYLLKALRETAFGKDNNADKIENYKDFKKHIKLNDYEDLRPYVERIKEGEEHVLWTGKPKYFCKTSGTTSGTKYIPMSDEGIKAQIRAARSSLLCYIHDSGNSSFADGKMIFLQGSPEMETINGISVGRLSGIVAHHVPSYLTKNRMPSWKTNSIDDWEKKVDAIVDETLNEDMRLISGIPPWVQMYFERLLEKSGKKTIRELYPNFSVFAQGGVNYKPYKSVMEKLIGGPIDTIETYPASEGFIAFQDSQKEIGMLLNLDAGIFYEFVPVDELHNENPARLSIGKVALDVNYAIVLNTSSGLWGYFIGDTVKFVSKSPYRLVVTGRIKHFISAFGEHVIGEEVDKAITKTSEQFGVLIQEFHVAPQVNPTEGLPYHEWFIESNTYLPKGFDQALDEAMQLQNSYYRDLITGNVLQPLKTKVLPNGSFNKYMDSIGKLGGQNKLPRLSNDRSIADRLV
jgi:hypothetical protein